MTAPVGGTPIRAIAAGGDGVGSLPDGRTVFVPRSAPGDLLRLRQVRTHARFARARIAAVLSPGPGRTTPPCPHYVEDDCGGCQLQHLAIEAQHAAKARIAGDAFRRIAKRDVPDPPLVAAPAQLGYRAKITFAWRDGRLGYHPLGAPDEVFDVRDCLLAEPEVRRLHQGVRTAKRLLPSHATRVVLRRDRRGDLHVVVRTGNDAPWHDGRALHAHLAARDIAAVVWWHPEGGAPRAVAGSDDPWPATAFEQVHPAMGDLVRAAAIDAAGDVAGRHAWDLYAGLGETTAALVARGATVESVELDARAVRHAERHGPAGPTRHTGRAESVVARLASPAIVITNPPRTGMDPAVSAAIGASGATRVVYVSCDPATLARDAGRLGDAWRLTALQAFDQFPQTAHLECVALLERR